MTLAGRIVVLIGLLALAGCASAGGRTGSFTGAYGGVTGGVAAGRS